MKPIPSLNVNLKPCHCQEPKKRAAPCEPGRHRPECGGPILIPCPIPGSFTCEVALGECTCFRQNVVGAQHLWAHSDDCPAVPIRVSCSITSDGTWAGSKISDIDPPHDSDGDDWGDAMWNACRERWALVRALVLGASKVSEFPEPFRMVPAVSEMLGQRNAVYAKICELARTERAYGTAYSEAWLTVGRHKASNTEGLASSTILGEYVEHLREQVGVLS